MEDHLLTPEIPPGTRYDLLVAESVANLKQLCDDIWNDYQPNDPGVTILEYLCYAIADLCYRLNFPLADLITATKDQSTPINYQAFFTAREILTTNPVTINDYRKLLIDLCDAADRRLVKNAWVEPVIETSAIKGLYHVYMDVVNKFTEQEAQALIKQARAKLAAHRNLCEDFLGIVLLKKQPVILNVQVQIADNIDAHWLTAKIYYEIQEFLSPTVHFYSLDALFNQGKSTADIFNGPALSQGFIDSVELENSQRRQVIHVSNLVSLIQKQPGVIAVHSITISSTSPTNLSEVHHFDLNDSLEVMQNAVFCLEDFDKQNITLTSSREANYPVDQNKVKQYLSQFNPAILKGYNKAQDIPIPAGRDRQLDHYVSIQRDFPACYGVNSNLPLSASEARKAYAKQLKAYLLIFDQILADHCTQLNHAKYLLAVNTNNNSPWETFFHLPLTSASVPDLETLLKTPETYPADLAKIKNELGELTHKNRLLNHLLARFSETFPDDAALSNQIIPVLHAVQPKLGNETLQLPILCKLKFLQDYPLLSSNRGKAFNYQLPYTQSNCSGLEQRLARMLGVAYDFVSGSQKAITFYLVEHHLLFLPPNNQLSASNNFLVEAEDLYSFQVSIIFPPAYVAAKTTITKLINTEIPAHIRCYLYWPDATEFGNFENIFKPWAQAIQNGSDVSRSAEALWKWLSDHKSKN